MKRITLSHGEGGKLTFTLIKEVFLKYFKNEYLSKLDDSAILEIKRGKICFTTDSYTVSPIFFPGGDIGKLSICGTINDLAVNGAKPLFFSCSFIIEEGTEIKIVEKVVKSMAKIAKQEKIKIVTGDTKVVEKGKADKIFINTTGIGIVDRRMKLGFERIKKGDVVIINGEIGLHGLAVITQRQGLEFESKIKSDCAALFSLIKEIFKFRENIKFMRDPTRGGLASALNEIATGTTFGIKIYQEKIPVNQDVEYLCEILGFDPLYIANEGKVVVIAERKMADKVVETMRKHKYGKKTEIIGEITDEFKGKVIIKTEIGTERIVEFPAGQQFPRIC